MMKFESAETMTDGNEAEVEWRCDGERADEADQIGDVFEAGGLSDSYFEGFEI